MATMQDRVIQAADTLLARDGAVGPLELVQELEFLYCGHVSEWQKGNEHYAILEAHIQCGKPKLEATWKHFMEWVRKNGLEPVEASYERATRFESEPLRITADGDPERERFFRTQFRRADLSPAKKKQIEKKLNKTPDLAVFEITSKEATCTECGEQLVQGELLFLEAKEPLCLTCADLDHLEFLPRGDTALTRRTRKYSPLLAIVLKFNRSRKRHERQGILAAPEAIARAEDECAADADERAARRQQDAARRADQDKQLVEEMTGVMLRLFPSCPAEEAEAIAAHTAARGSGRVGRSAAGRSLSEQAITLAVRAWIRHQHTRYDKLLMQGVPRHDARDQIAADVDAVAEAWSG